jgi:hypothetical protein
MRVYMYVSHFFFFSEHGQKKKRSYVSGRMRLVGAKVKDKSGKSEI